MDVRPLHGGDARRRALRAAGAPRAPQSAPAVSGDLVVVTGSPRRDPRQRERGDVAALHGVQSETSLRDAVKGLARDLDLRVEDVERNAGRLVVRERDLLEWLDRDREAPRGSGAARRARRLRSLGRRRGPPRDSRRRRRAPTRALPRRFRGGGARRAAGRARGRSRAGGRAQGVAARERRVRLFKL